MLLDRIAAYWDLRADGYSETIHEELTGDSGVIFRKYLNRAMPKGRYLRCLDMGCGLGFFTLLLGGMGHIVTSADYSPEMLERTRKNCAEAGLTAHTVRADAQNLPFEDGMFDFVCSRNLVWNLERPEAAYAEWRRVLKPRGRLFIADGNHYLYYYNDDYRRARKLAEANGRRAHHTIKGVDPTPINEMARELPLSKQLRPEWDVRVLENVGFRIIGMERFMNAFVDPSTNEEKTLTHNFVLWAEKD